MKLAFATAMLFGLTVMPVHAHGPTPKKVDESIALAAAPQAVWKQIQDFGAIAHWHPSVKQSSASKGNENGSVRELTLAGGVLKESLDEYDPQNRSYSYRLDTENVEALPVSSYSATITVQPAASGAGSQVAWIARFYRGDTGNYPAENLNDEAAVAAMTAFIQSGLQGIKDAAEGR